MTRRLKPIKLTKTDIVRFWEKADRRGLDECWEWIAGRDKDGYGIFRYGGRAYRSNRVAYVIMNGDTELLVLHTCHNPSCWNSRHLYAGSPKDNSNDREIAGRAADHRGEEHGRAKLSDSDIHVIRILRAKGRLLREIAVEYDLERSHVGRICSGARWEHI